MPGLPLFCLTRFTAAVTVPRSTTRSIRGSVPERPVPCAAVSASPLRCAFGASPRSASGSSTCVDLWRLAPPRRTVVSRSLPFGPSPRQSLLPSPGCPPWPASARLLWPLLTARAATSASPLQAHGERAPGKNALLPRTVAACTSPGPLTPRASRALAGSPGPAPPRRRFVYLDSRFRSTLPPHARSPSRSCASLRSLWSACGRTCTSRIAPMLGAPTRKATRRWPCSQRSDRPIVGLRLLGGAGSVLGGCDSSIRSVLGGVRCHACSS